MCYPQDCISTGFSVKFFTNNYYTIERTVWSKINIYKDVIYKKFRKLLFILFFLHNNLSTTINQAQIQYWMLR